MPRRHRDNENLRRVNREGVDGAKLMRRMAREKSNTTAVGRAMQDARRRAGLDAD